MKLPLFILLVSLVCFSISLPCAQALFSKGLEDENKAEEKVFKDLKEAKDQLQSLLKEKKKLTGDFYGINITAYRYANIFYPLGYISYKIRKLDEEIEKTRLQIEKLKLVTTVNR